MNIAQNGMCYEKQEDIGILSFDRPKALNAMNTGSVNEMKRLLAEIEEDKEVRCLILTGTGPKAFCAGGDIQEEVNNGVLEAYQFVRNGAALLETMERFRVPILAAINGYCLGGGLEFALACDIRIAADNARLGSPEVTLGVYPGWGGTQRLPRVVGISQAKLLMFTGRKISAAQALDIGLVDQVVPAAELMDTAVALAKEIAQYAPLTVKYLKTAVYDGMQCDLQRALQIEAALFAHLYCTQDTKEAYAAFLEKRPHHPYLGR